MHSLHKSSPRPGDVKHWGNEVELKWDEGRWLSDGGGIRGNGQKISIADSQGQTEWASFEGQDGDLRGLRAK